MRPDVVLGMMNNDLSGMTVADLFAGDGYFTFRLIQAGAKVIAIDNDPANIAKLEARKKELGLTDDQLIVRGAAVGDPGLAPDEADVALLVHHYVGIANKPDFFKRMRQGLRFPRALMLIDWQKQPTPMGPPEHERLDQNLIMDQILEMGYSEVGAHSDKLPYQVVFFATDPMDAL
jgi:cyclopropane fatty-acyl-phospholipid synthase-like methyltransferase